MSDNSPKIVIKVVEEAGKDITMSLGKYGLIRNNTHSFRFVQTDDICGIVKNVDKLFHLSSRMEQTLFLIIEDWLEPRLI